MLHLPEIQTWSDIAAIVSVVSFPLILASLMAAFGQVRAQAEISRRELSFNGMTAFNEKFERNADAYQNARVRFDNGDRAINKQAARQVYNGYWRLVHEEWEFYRNGLLPLDLFTGWMLLSYSQMAGETSLKYFLPDGTVEAMNSAERFESVVYTGRYQRHPLFHEFISGLYQVRAKDAERSFLAEADRLAAVTAYIRQFSKKHGITPIS